VELDAIERQLLREAVEAEGGNLAAAARRLGITRAQLAYRLQRLEQPPA
jgi:transcriptional regulator with GAF, ATPase, and Fis domain